MSNIFDWLKNQNNGSQGSNVENINKVNTQPANSQFMQGVNNYVNNAQNVQQNVGTQNKTFFQNLVDGVKESFQISFNKDYRDEKVNQFNQRKAQEVIDIKDQRTEQNLNSQNANNIFQYKDQDGNLYGFYDAKQTLDTYVSRIKEQENKINSLDVKAQAQQNSGLITKDYYDNYVASRNEMLTNLDALLQEANDYSNRLNSSTVELVDHDTERQQLVNRNEEINNILAQFDSKYNEQEMNAQIENQETLNWVNSLYDEENRNLKRIEELDDFKTMQNEALESSYYKNLQKYGTQEEIANYNEYLANERNAWKNKKNFLDGVLGGITGGTNMVVSAAYNMVGGVSQALDFQIAKYDATQPYIEEANQLKEQYMNGELSYDDFINQNSDLAKNINISNDQVYDENSFGNRMVQNAQKYNEYAMAGREGVDKFIIEAWGSSVPFLMSYLFAQPFATAAGLALGIDASTLVGAKKMADITKNIALGGMAITEYGNQVNSVLSMKNDDGSYKYSVQTANMNALLHGATTFLVEQIGADAFANALTGEVGQYWFQRSISDLASYGSKYIGRSMLNGAISEGTEEGLENFITTIIDGQTLGTIDSENIGDFLWQALSQWWNDGDIIHTMVVAGVSGGFTNMVGAGERIIQVQSNVDYKRLSTFASQVDIELTNKMLDPNISIVDKEKIRENKVAFDSVVEQALKGYQDKNVSSSFAIISDNDVYEFETIDSVDGAIKEALAPDITNQISNEVETKQALDTQISFFNDLIGNSLNSNGIYYGLDDQTIESLNKKGAYVENTKFYALGKEVRSQMIEASKIINEMGVDNYSFAILRGKNGQIIDGANVDGKIVINPICIKGDISTYIHELFHRYENLGLASEITNDVVKAIKDQYAATFENLDEIDKANFEDANQFAEEMYERLLQNKINDYANIGQTLTRESAISEVVTEEVQNRLGNKEFIDSIIKSNESLAYRIYSTIKAQLSGDAWQKIAKEYENAYRKLLKNRTVSLNSPFALSAVADELKNNVKDTYTENVRTSDLIAIHNLSEDKLMASIDLGGFVMPSIAITKASIGHSGFGNISLLFDKNTIDPSKKDNKVYKRDAWTPTFPSIENELITKKVSELRNRFYDLSKKVDPQYANELRNALNKYTNTVATPDDINTIVENLKSKNSFKAAYLEENGKHIEVEKTKQEYYTQEEKDLYEKILDIVKSFDATSEELYEKYGDQIKPLMYERFISKGNSESQAARKSSMMTFFNMFISNTLKYKSKIDNNDTYYVVPNTQKANSEINEQIDQEKYEQWLRDILEGMFGEKGIWNGKPYITDSGRTRTFKQMYREVTLDNILNDMKSKGNGGDGWSIHENTGFNAVSGLLGSEFKNIDEIIEKEGNLTGSAEKDAQYEQLSEKYYELLNDLKENYYKYPIKDVESMISSEDNYGYALRDLVKKKITESNIIKSFADNNYNIDKQMATRIKELIDSIDNLSTGYFEAKPRRIVTLDEIQRAIIPIDSSNELIQKLNENNIAYLMYDPSIEDSRSGVVDAQNDLKFSYVSKKGIKNLVRNFNNLSSDAKTFTKNTYDRFEEAKKMLKDGHSPLEIYAQTNMVVGKDNRIRVEVFDDIDFVIDNFPTKSGEYNLTDVFDRNSILYKAYPQLSSTKVIVDLESKNEKNPPKGRYKSSDGNIYLFKKAEPSTILHELQHKIQDIEGLDQGTNKKVEKLFSLASKKFWEYYLDAENLSSFKESLNYFANNRRKYNTGEIEARDTQKRMSDYDVLKNTLPSILSQEVEENISKYYDDSRGNSYAEINKIFNSFNNKTISNTGRLTSKTRFSFTNQYNEATLNGDNQKAQELVDKVAKANGYNPDEKVYHGTNANNINVFDGSFSGVVEDNGKPTLIKGYFSSSEDYSSSYGNNVHPYYLRDGKYINLESAYDVDDMRRQLESQGVKDVVFNEFVSDEENIKDWFDEIGYVYGEDVIDPWHFFTHNGGNITQKIKEAGYQGIVWEEGDGVAYMPFNSEDIKLAEPIVYDENGTIIPLEERFNDSNNDVRFSYIKNVVNDLNRKYGSRTTNNVRKLMDQLDTEMKEDGFFYMDTIEELGNKLIESIKDEKNDIGYNKTELRKAIKNNEISWDSLKGYFNMNSQDFRKEYPFIKLVKDGKSGWDILQRDIDEQFGNIIGQEINDPKDLFDKLKDLLNEEEKVGISNQMKNELYDDLYYYLGNGYSEENSNNSVVENDETIESNKTKTSFADPTYNKVTNQEIKEAVEKKEMDIAIDMMGLNDPAYWESLDQTIDQMANKVVSTKDIGPKEGKTQVDFDYKKEKQLVPVKDVAKKLARDFTNKGKFIWDLSRRLKSDNIWSLYNQYLNSQSQANNMLYKKNGLADILNEIPKDQQEDFNYMVYHGVNIDAAKYNKNVFEDFTSEQSERIFNQYMLEHPNWKSTYDKIIAYEDNLTDMLLQNGRIDRATVDKWKEMYPHYVHVSRVFVEDAEMAEEPKPKVQSSNKNTVKERTGGKQDLKPLKDALSEQTLNVFKSINMNNFAKEYANVSTSKKTNWKDISIEQLTGEKELPYKGISLNTELKAADENNPATLIYYTDGQINIMEIPNDLYDVFQSNRKDNVVTTLLQGANNIRRNAITGMNPIFMVTNPIKDVQDVMYKSEHPLATYSKIPKAMIGLAMYGSDAKSNNKFMNNAKELANAWKSLGGGQNGIVDVHSRSALYNYTIGMIERLNNYVESVPRFAEFIASLEKGRTPTQAMYDSDKVTTNFKMGGEYTKFLDRNGATFLNASVQGLTELVQGYEREYDKNGMKGVLGKMAISTLVLNVPLMIINHMMWKDDEDYQNLSDYIKDNYYIVGKTNNRFVRIPKGRIAAAYQSVLKTLWDNGVELVGDNDATTKAKNMWENSIDGINGVWDNIGVNNPFTNNMFAPIYQVATNKTWYGDDLLSEYELKKDPSKQYDYSTDLFSKWVGENINYSPKKINYLLDQYTGGLGDVALPMLTPKAETELDDGTIGGKIASAVISPFVDKFSSDFVFKNQNVSDLFKLDEELTKQASKDKATDEIKLAQKYISSIKYKMFDLYGQRADIYNDSSLTDAEKYRQARLIQSQIDSIAKEGINAYDQMDISGQYANVNGLGFTKDEEGSWTKIKSEVNDELSSLGMNTSQTSEYLTIKDTIASNNRINSLQGYYQQIEEIKGSKLSENIKKDRISELNTKISNAKEKMTEKDIALANGDYNNKAANFELIAKSNLNDEQKNYAYNKFFDSNLNDYIDEFDASDSDKMYIKYLASTQTSDKDENGKTIEHSKAKKIVDVYKEYGVLDQVLNYIQEYDVEPSVFGLNKTVYNNLINGTPIGTSSSKKSSYFNSDGTLTQKGFEKILSSIKNASTKDASSIVKNFVSKAIKKYDIPTTYDDVKTQFEKKYGKLI